MSKHANHGENNGRCKLTLETVQVIRHLLQQGVQGKHIAKVYGISNGLVSGIKTGKLWSAPEDKLKYKEW